MKKLLIVTAALLLLVPAVASAQGLKMTQAEFNKKGAIALSGNLINFNNVKNDDADEGPSRIGIAPSVGYMLMDNLQVNFGFGYINTTNGDASDSTVTVTPGARYYFDMLSKNNLFPSIGASYSLVTQTEDSGVDGASEVETKTGDLRVGIAITQAMGAAQGGFLTLGLDYSLATFTPDGDDAEDINLSGLDVSVGFGLYF